MENQVNFEIVVHNSEKYWQTVTLRDKVLRKPLALVFSEEELMQEKDSFHFLCQVNDEVAACLILKPLNDKVKMRQVAVASEWQGKKIGKQLVEFAENYAREKGFTEIELHARASAIAFYLKLSGYQVIGEMFEEVGLPHWAMRKKL